MSEARALRKKVAELRAPLADPAPPRDHLRQLQQSAAAGRAKNAETALLVRQAAADQMSTTPLPGQLTANTRRLLLRAQDLVKRLRGDTDRLATIAPSGGVARLHRESIALTELALRVAASMPGDTEAQLSLCEGLESLLNAVADKTARLQMLLAQQEGEAQRVRVVADSLNSLARGSADGWPALLELAERLADDAANGVPLHSHLAGRLTANRFHPTSLEPARVVACHGLNVAQVIARLVRHDPKFTNDAQEAIAVALVMDLGMLGVPRDHWLHAGPLSAGQRRKVEAHVRAGADVAARLIPEAGWLHEAIAGHHERLDGTGYPGGRREKEVAALARLLAVADRYAALVEPRPHRRAFDPRGATAEVLEEAEKGWLDRNYAERLLQLSLYPVGTLVELADGATALVVGTHLGRRDHHTAARPVVALLTDSQGEALAVPRHLDLNDCEGHSITRALSPSERQDFLSRACA